MKFEEEPNAAEAPSLPLALRRIHEKLLKHHHMNLELFKRRTAELQIPIVLYELYAQLAALCPTGQEMCNLSRAQKSSFQGRDLRTSF